MLSPCTQAWPTCHQGLLRIPAQLRRTALSSSPCMCPSQYQALTWTKPNSFPPQHHHVPATLHTVCVLRGLPRRSPGKSESHHGLTQPEIQEPSQEVIAEEEQPLYYKLLKTNKARGLKALLGHCEWKLQDYASRWLHTYRTAHVWMHPTSGLFEGTL